MGAGAEGWPLRPRLDAADLTRNPQAESGDTNRSLFLPSTNCEWRFEVDARDGRSQSPSSNFWACGPISLQGRKRGQKWSVSVVTQPFHASRATLFVFVRANTSVQTHVRFEQAAYSTRRRAGTTSCPFSNTWMETG